LGTKEQPQLDSKIHDHNAAFYLVLLANNSRVFFLWASQRQLEHGLLIPTIAFFASANLFDDPGIEHQKLPLTSIIL
jgi:hypothetical protein